MKIQLTKIIVSVSAVAIVSSAFYYFVIFAPSEKLLSRQIECKKIAQELHDKNINEQKINEDRSKQMRKEWFDKMAMQNFYTLSIPIFKFSKEMNTCLYKIGFYKGLSPASRKCSVIDVYNNSTLISYEISIDLMEAGITKISLEDQEKYDSFLLSEKRILGSGDCEFDELWDMTFKTRLNPKT